MNKKVKTGSNYNPLVHGDPEILVAFNEKNLFGSNYVLSHEKARESLFPQAAQSSVPIILVPKLNPFLHSNHIPSNAEVSEQEVNTGSSSHANTNSKAAPTNAASGVPMGLVGSLILVLLGLIVVRHIVAPIVLFAVFWVLVGALAYGLLRMYLYSGLSTTFVNTFYILIGIALIAYIAVLQSGKAVSSYLPSF